MVWSFPTFFSFMSLPFGIPATFQGPAQFACSGKSLEFATTGKIVIVMLAGSKLRQVLHSSSLGYLIKLADHHSFLPWYFIGLLRGEQM